MRDVVSRTREFLKAWGVSPDCVDMHELLDVFHSEMERGLAGKGGSL